MIIKSHNTTAGLYKITYNLIERNEFKFIEIHEKCFSDSEKMIETFPVSFNQEKAEEIFDLFCDNHVLIKGAQNVLDDLEDYLA